MGSNVYLTRALMTVSATVTGGLGIVATFMPHEVATWVGAEATATLVIVIQVLGALYIGFAILNWMSRQSLIGGIYNRPLAAGNLVHYGSAGIAMVKALFASSLPSAFIGLTIVYVLLAIAYAVIIFTHPVRPEEPAES